MHIAPIGSAITPIQAIMPKTPNPAEGAGPDTDGDGDEGGSAVKSMTAPGVGQTIDISA